MDMKQAKSIMLCSEIVDLHWKQRAGRERELKANLEEIWASGARFLMDVRVPLRTTMWFKAGNREFRAKVSSRKFVKGLGYLVEAAFASKSQWSEAAFRPKHLLNPLVLLGNKIFAAMPVPPVSPAESYIPAAFDSPLDFRQARRHAV